MSSILPRTSEHAQQEPLEPLFVPPLEEGDRLTRAEFERRYAAMPHLHKAELIEGEVHMPSPVRIKKHGQPQFDLNGLLWLYKVNTPGVAGGDNATVRLDMNNEPQPDGLLFIEPECGGRVRIDEDDYINGAPDLAAEISVSTVSIDLGKKLQAYQKNEVREYVVWRVQDRAIDWFAWQNGAYQHLAATADGIVQSRVFPGLWLDLTAIVGGDFVRAQAVLQFGLQSPEHTDFVAGLQAKRLKK